MTEQLVQSVAVICAFVAFGSLLVAIARKAASQNRRPAGGTEEEFINIALCETRTGVRTHYHAIGFEALNYGGYPVGKEHPTLCGAETGWDMQNQDSEATCETCLEALANMTGENDVDAAAERKARNKLGMPG